MALSIHNLLRDTIPQFPGMSWKLRKTSVMTAGLRSEICTWYRPYTKQDRSVGSFRPRAYKYYSHTFIAIFPCNIYIYIYIYCVCVCMYVCVQSKL